LSDHPIAARWRVLRQQGRAALIPYVTGGFPDPGESLDILRRAEAAGADLIEVGLPFSDPLADGPTIQRSTQAALERGVTAESVLRIVSEAELRIPVVVMTYLNPVLAYGVDRFLSDARAAGVSGVLLTDVPVGADPVLEERVAASPLALIRLLAPTTTDARLAAASRRATGFLYLISRLGVTGARDTIPPDLEAQVARVRAATRLPVAIGFGISTPEQAAYAARIADGVVVGSAVVDALASGGAEAAEQVIRRLAAAVRMARTAPPAPPARPGSAAPPPLL
jgi:tryptophan synthase alpha chain